MLLKTGRAEGTPGNSLEIFSSSLFHGLFAPLAFGRHLGPDFCERGCCERTASIYSNLLCCLYRTVTQMTWRAAPERKQ